MKLFNKKLLAREILIFWSVFLLGGLTFLMLTAYNSFNITALNKLLKEKPVMEKELSSLNKWNNFEINSLYNDFKESKMYCKSTLPSNDFQGNNIIGALKEFYELYDRKNSLKRQDLEKIAKEWAGDEANLWKELYNYYAPKKRDEIFYDDLAYSFDNPYNYFRTNSFSGFLEKLQTRSRRQLFFNFFTKDFSLGDDFESFENKYIDNRLGIWNRLQEIDTEILHRKSTILAKDKIIKITFITILVVLAIIYPIRLILYSLFWAIRTIKSQN